MRNFLDLSDDKRKTYVHRAVEGIQLKQTINGRFGVVTLSHGDLTKILEWLSTTPVSASPAQARWLFVVEDDVAK